MMASSTSASSATVKGRPLVMLAVLLSVWVGSRIILWESPFPSVEAMPESATQLLASQSGDENVDRSVTASDVSEAFVPPAAASSLPDWNEPTLDWPAAVPSTPLEWEDRSVPDLAPTGETAAAHQLVWMAAMAHLPVPRSIEERMAVPSQSSTEPTQGRQPQDRWALDAWAFWRDGGAGPLLPAGRAPTYGASQAGAVLSYRLAPQHKRDPRAYARVYRALIDNGESEIAAGLSARPIPAVPLRAHAELRVTEFATSTEVRPAAFITTELPQAPLPLGLKAEAYGQAGYVAGEEATAFADGQVHVLRSITDFDLGQISVGGAAWAGAQKGAERVDVGPAVRADFRIGDVPARVSVDYRERVAGDAEPPSGVAVTLSTRF